MQLGLRSTAPRKFMALINQLNNLNYISWRLEFIENFRGCSSNSFLIYCFSGQGFTKLINQGPPISQLLYLPWVFGSGKSCWQDCRCHQTHPKSASPQPPETMSRRITNQGAAVLAMTPLDTQPQTPLEKMAPPLFQPLPAMAEAPETTPLGHS